ncbi:MAG TPA: hypothetical protein VK828_16730 [Terriglobales bacterium]|jgi:hypothetical protein|nr:hypothetical protein [Terriglobales bacterium]
MRFEPSTPAQKTKSSATAKTAFQLTDVELTSFRRSLTGAFPHPSALGSCRLCQFAVCGYEYRLRCAYKYSILPVQDSHNLKTIDEIDFVFCDQTLDFVGY